MKISQPADCPLRQLLASRHLDGGHPFDWPDDSHCPDCKNAWASCRCKFRRFQ